MNKILTLAGMISIFAALPANAHPHEWNDNDRTMMLNHLMAKMDTNGDGVITRDEHQAAAAEMFRNADVNGDNLLTKEELAHYKAQDRIDAGMPHRTEPVQTNPHPHKDK